MLDFDIDARQIEGLIEELGATDRQAKFALGRALRRTAATLRRQSERGLKSELDIKRTAYLRRRLKSLQFRSSSLSGTKLWYGLDDMPVSALRGRIKAGKGGTGASFAGKAGSETFDGAFIVKGKRGRTIMRRKGKSRLPIVEARLPVQDDMNIYVEDVIFPQVNDIFWSHFERDMRARAAHGVGQA